MEEEKKPSHYWYTIWLVVLAVVCLIGMGSTGLIVTSVTSHPQDNSKPDKVLDAPYTRPTLSPQHVTVGLFYRGYGNTFIRMSPRYCFTGWEINNIKQYLPDKKDKWCGQIMVDLAQDLRKGYNTLTVDVAPTDAAWRTYSPIVGLSVGVPLFGYGLGQSFFTLIFVCCVLDIVWLILSRRGWNLPMRLIFVAALALYMQCLQAFHHFDFTLDWEKHAPYMQYVSEHFFSPYGYLGPTHWHPPLYYWLCAIVSKILEAFGVFDVWTGIRLISVASYSVFIYFGMKTIGKLLPGRTGTLAMALLAFWPASLFCSAWLYNDVLLYPAYAACFYYILLWYDDNAPRSLFKAMVACSIAFMVKGTAIAVAAVLAACVLAKILSKQCQWRDLKTRENVIGAAILLFGFLFDNGQHLYYSLISHQDWQFLGEGGDYHTTLASFLPLDVPDLIRRPFFVSWDDPSLWNIQIRTLLFTNTVWQAPDIAAWLEMLCLLMLAYTAVFIITSPLARFLTLLPLIAGLVLPWAAVVWFTLSIHMGSGMDFRYIQPAMVALLITFFLAVQETKKKNWMLLYYAGYGIAIAFIAISIIFFEVQAFG